MANRYQNDPFNQYSPYQPSSSMNFPGSGSAEFLQFPGFYYSSHGMQQGAEQFNPTVQAPSLPTQPSNPGPSTQKSHKRWQTKDEAVLVQLWADNIERLESKDSRKAWDEIVRALNDKQGITKTVASASTWSTSRISTKKRKTGTANKVGEISRKAPLRCPRRGTRLPGCNNLQKVEASRDHHARASARWANTRKQLDSFARYPLVRRTRNQVQRQHDAKNEKTDESALERLRATRRMKALKMWSKSFQARMTPWVEPSRGYKQPRYSKTSWWPSSWVPSTDTWTPKHQKKIKDRVIVESLSLNCFRLNGTVFYIVTFCYANQQHFI